jgi:Zn-dependent M28 family amino/carboxypeptidase
MATRLIWLLIMCALGCNGCGRRESNEIKWSLFDGQKAYAHVEKLVGYGPRPSGHNNLIRSATYIATQMQEFGLETEEQVFLASTPRGPLQFRNVIARTREQRPGEPIIIIGSHYDTKALTNAHFVGANDGGSSTGALLEMARVASGQANLWFVFFDGEEALVEYADNDGLQGSRYFVEDLKGRNLVKRVKAMVLLDMVGDANLQITLPANGVPALKQKLFDAARDTGNRDYFSVTPATITDDHVPFLRAGIPAIDIIDFEYGSASGLNDYWHTDKDTLDKISRRSLAIVGQTALRFIELLKQIPAVP